MNMTPVQRRRVSDIGAGRHPNGGTFPLPEGAQAPFRLQRMLQPGYEAQGTEVATDPFQGAFSPLFPPPDHPMQRLAST